LFAGRISEAGLVDRLASWAKANAAALKSMKAKKQLAAQARAIFTNELNPATEKMKGLIQPSERHNW
jgi:hypothetical protein